MRYYRYKYQAPKKGINIKNFARNAPPRPPLQGAPDPCKFFMFGAFFPFKTQEKPKHKEFGGGGGGASKILYAEILRVFFRALKVSRDMKIRINCPPPTPKPQIGVCPRKFIPLVQPYLHFRLISALQAVSDDM